MSILSLAGLILFAAGLLLLLVDTRIGIASIALGVLALQWMGYRRRSERLKRLKGMRDELRELNWLEKRRWFFHGDGY
jgi:membrane protein implicated in regulation of membrane protease activity